MQDEIHVRVRSWSGPSQSPGYLIVSCFRVPDLVLVVQLGSCVVNSQRALTSPQVEPTLVHVPLLTRATLEGHGDVIGLGVVVGLRKSVYGGYD